MLGGLGRLGKLILGKLGVYTLYMACCWRITKSTVPPIYKLPSPTRPRMGEWAIMGTILGVMVVIYVERY